MRRRLRELVVDAVMLVSLFGALAGNAYVGFEVGRDVGRTEALAEIEAQQRPEDE